MYSNVTEGNIVAVASYPMHFSFDEIAFPVIIYAKDYLSINLANHALSCRYTANMCPLKISVIAVGRLYWATHLA